MVILPRLFGLNILICAVAGICQQSHESNSLRSDAIYRKLFNNDMQYLIECSEKIVRDDRLLHKICSYEDCAGLLI